MADKKDNLKPFVKGTISREVAAANGAKGGRAKAQKKTVAEYLRNGRTVRLAKRIKRR